MKKGASLFVILFEYINIQKENRKTCVKGGSSYGIYEWKRGNPAG